MNISLLYITIPRTSSTMADEALGDDVPFDTESTINAVEGNAVEDAAAVDVITDLLDNVAVAEETSGMVEYKGSMVKQNTALAMTYIVDKMQGHFGRPNIVPDIRFRLPGNLTHLPYDERYKNKGEDPSDRYFGEVKCRYDIEDTIVTFPIFAADNVYIDMIPKTNKSGDMAKGYGKTWLNLYFPKITLKRIIEKFKENTNWGVSKKGMTSDDGQGLISVVANINEDDPPKFLVLAREFNEDDDPTGRVFVNNHGSIQSVFSNPDLQQIYKCTAFMSMTMNVLVPCGTTTEPSPSPNNLARLKFSLSSIKAYGVAENVTTVRLGASKVKSHLFR